MIQNGAGAGTGQILLIGNDSDMLHSGYTHAISEAGKRYPSVNHYAHSMTLSRLGVGEHVLLDLLSVPTRDVAHKARELLLENMPAGHDLNSLSAYLSNSRQSYTMQGLRLRAEQDKAFERGLMETRESLLVVCDSRDKELGIGMEEAAFADWMNREHVDAGQIAYWMRDGTSKPAVLGSNQLGYYLMWLRHEVREKKQLGKLTAKSRAAEGISRDQNEKLVTMNVNDLVIALSGVFRPLSNYYPMRFEMKGESYRSVEHYAYEKLFVNLKLDEKQVEKITTTVLPIDIPLVAQRIFHKLGIADSVVESKAGKLDRWRQSAMKHKLSNNDYLQQLLLSTGDALLVDFAPGDAAWTCRSSEAELQRLLAKSYIDSEKLIGWMRDKAENVPKMLRHLQGNKTGMLLMELRTRLADKTPSRIPLVSPMDVSVLSTQVTPHLVCFTAESVWHPLYPAEICPAPGQPLLPSPAHYIAQEAIKFLSLNKPDAEYIMEEKSSVTCWQRLHEVLEERSSDMDRETQWWMAKRQTALREALLLLLEQHPPLLRALLDTRDAMLVYCARFSSTEGELSIGMRESDVRAWMHHVEMDTKQLMELCNRPMAFRPPYLGGNRLGFLLMDLRRDFVLRGLFPHTLPDLNIGADAILGSDSAAESMMVLEPFDVMDTENYTGLTINQLLLLAKETGDAELLSAASRKKAPPRLVSLDEEKVAGIMDDLEAMAGKVDPSYIGECPPEELRAVFLRLLQRVRRRMAESDFLQNEMGNIAKEINQMAFMRRSLETERARTLEVHQQAAQGPGGGPLPPHLHNKKMMSSLPEPDGPPQPLLSLPLRRTGSPQPMREPPGGGGGAMQRRAPAGADSGRFNGQQQQQNMAPPQRRRSPDRKIRGDLIPPPARRVASSPPRRLRPNNNYGNYDDNRAPPAKRGRQSPPPTQNAPAVEIVEKKPPPPKVKVPRPADEVLSDGEILSSDEET